MTTIADPILGSWYKDMENSLTFKVIAVDDGGDAIQVQYLNGDIGEYDQDSWYGSTFDYIEDPEDWSAPYDDLEKDDLGYSDPDRHNRSSDDLDLDDYLDEA